MHPGRHSPLSDPKRNQGIPHAGAVLLRVEKFTKHYGQELALDQVTFEIRAGEVLGLIGPNGAGKTTLLECLAGLLPAEAGDVYWSHETEPLAVHRRKDVLFYVPETAVPWPDQRVANILTFIGRARRVAPGRIGAVANALGLDGNALSKRVSALSKGYRRRVLLAIALLAPQPVLVMDEPFDGFDLRQTQLVVELLRQTALQNARTLLLSIHQVGDAEQACDRFVLLRAGRVRGVGTLSELRAATGLAKASLEEIFLALA
jgi:ABC-2 type transport system ATP-binding protein